MLVQLVIRERRGEEGKEDELADSIAFEFARGVAAGVSSAIVATVAVLAGLDDTIAAGRHDGASVNERTTGWKPVKKRS
jgi:hypothetical protein